MRTLQGYVMHGHNDVFEIVCRDERGVALPLRYSPKNGAELATLLGAMNEQGRTVTVSFIDGEAHLHATN
jgi:hypothetical protein